MKKKSAKKPKRPNLHDQLSERRRKRPVGHEGGKRVAAFKHRANVIPSNGDLPTSTEVAPERVPIGEAMRRAVEELGEPVINDELAPAQLRQLSEAYEQVTREQAAFNAKSEAAKIAKKSLDSSTAMLLEKVRSFTHPSPLPLFDQVEAEADRENMIEASNETESIELGLTN